MQWFFEYAKQMPEISVARVTSGIRMVPYPFRILLPEYLFQQLRLQTHVIGLDDVLSKLLHCIISKVLQGQFNGAFPPEARPCCAVDMAHH